MRKTFQAPVAKQVNGQCLYRYELIFSSVKWAHERARIGIFMKLGAYRLRSSLEIVLGPQRHSLNQENLFGNCFTSAVVNVSAMT